MITVPSTPPRFPSSKMKVSPSPHSVQFPYLGLDEQPSRQPLNEDKENILCPKSVNEDEVTMQASFRTTTSGYSQISSPIKPPRLSLCKVPLSADAALKGKLTSVQEFRHSLPLTPVACSQGTVRETLPRRSTIRIPYFESPKNELVHNKVFQKQYNSAAITIQRVIRGFWGRCEVAPILLAHRQTIQKEEASITIQANVRGWRCRLRIRVFQMESELRAIEKRKESDLLEIQVWKKQEMEKIRHSALSISEKARQKCSRNEKMLEAADKIIMHFRKENKKLRDKNDALQVAIDLMLEENKMMDKQMLEYQSFLGQMNDMVLVNNENAAYIGLLAQYEEKVVEFEQAISCRDERIMFENKVGRLYLNSIQAIVLCIEDSCQDEDLVFSVEELCLKCNIPGSGSGLDELDVSERMF